MVFVGTPNAPETHCGNEGGAIPATTVNKTPLIAEKPFITSDGSAFSLVVPNFNENTSGSTAVFDDSNSSKIDFKNVYVASSSDTAETIN